MGILGSGTRRISRRKLLLGGGAVAAGLLASRWISGDLPVGRPWVHPGQDELPRRLERRARLPLAPSFVVGANYEGPADRAWQMWKPDLFDSSLIDEDLARAANIGLDGVRIFVQAPLEEQIRQGDWWRMDAVLDIAERRGLSLLMTLADFPESDLWNRATIAGAIAHRYAGRTAVAGYDLKNEPQIGDLVTALYPRTDELDA